MLNRRFSTRRSLLLCTSLIAPSQAQSSSYRCRFSLFRTVFQRNCWDRLRAVVGGSKAIALSAFLTKFHNTSQYKNNSNEQLTKAYYQAKQEGKLKLAKLLVPKIFYLRNSDFVGKKYCEAGAIVEAEEYDNVICHIWLSPVECEFIFPNEVEFI